MSRTKGFLPGPYEKRLALDEVVQMMGGLSYMTGPAGRPLRAGTSVNDIMGGMFGAIGVLAALRERDRTGRGQEIQSALFENCVFPASQHMQQFAMTGEAPPPMPSRVSAWSVYDVFTLANDEQLFIGAVSDKQFVTLCHATRTSGAGRSARIPRQRVACGGATPVAGRTGRHPSAPSCRSFDAAARGRRHPLCAHRPSGPATRHDPHLKESGGLVPMQVDDGSIAPTVLLPLMMGGRRPGVRHPLPSPGEHNDEVLGRIARPG